MGGFKSGAADDDWGEEDSINDTEATSEATDHQSQRQDGNPTDERSQTRVERSQNTRLPWIHRRNSITDGREKTVQLHLQDSTVDAEREGKTDVEDLLGESVRKADLREAALVVGLKHSDEIAKLLREWGYAVE